MLCVNKKCKCFAENYFSAIDTMCNFQMCTCTNCQKSIFIHIPNNQVVMVVLMLYLHGSQLYHDVAFLVKIWKSRSGL